MALIPQFLRPYLCGKHQPRYIRTIYGDETNLAGARERWNCETCGHWETRRAL